jgi:hypothetical protein
MRRPVDQKATMATCLVLTRVTPEHATGKRCHLATTFDMLPGLPSELITAAFLTCGPLPFARYADLDSRVVATILP